MPSVTTKSSLHEVAVSQAHHEVSGSSYVSALHALLLGWGLSTTLSTGFFGGCEALVPLPLLPEAPFGVLLVDHFVSWLKHPSLCGPA